MFKVNTPCLRHKGPRPTEPSDNQPESDGAPKNPSAPARGTAFGSQWQGARSVGQRRRGLAEPGYSLGEGQVAASVAGCWVDPGSADRSYR